MQGLDSLENLKFVLKFSANPGGGITPVQFCKAESALLNPGYGISLLHFGLAAESIYTQAQNRM
jgi:hypothetical protein